MLFRSVPTSRELGISQIVWSPVAQGILTGKYKPGAEAPEGSMARPGGLYLLADRLADETFRAAKLEPEMYRRLRDVPAEALFDTVPEFRRVPNLFEILSYEYWRLNHGFVPAPGVADRRLFHGTRCVAEGARQYDSQCPDRPKPCRFSRLNAHISCPA